MRTLLTLVLGSYVAPMVVASFLVFGAAASETAGAQWVNVGSNSGLFAFDWESANVSGLNLAGSPQSMRRDVLKLKARRKEICAGAFVIVPICLFSSVLPESYDKRPSATTHSLLSFDGMPDKQSMAGSAELLDRIWKKEFSIREYSDPMTKENRKSYYANVAYMRGFIAWCKEADLKPVFVLPPAAECLRRLFPDSFLQTYVYDFVRDVTKGTDVRFLDYWRDAEFLDVRLYATSLFLNKTGRRRFTARVIADFSRKDMADK